jgi:hypothetical protein
MTILGRTLGSEGFFESAFGLSNPDQLRLHVAPQFMKVGVLTAALQELTPRKFQDADPDRAVEEWLAFWREIGATSIQLSAALHPTKTDVPPEAMLDPLANTLDLQTPFDAARHDPLAYLQNRTVDWLDHQLAARELLRRDVANTHLVVEHEFPKARLQDRERVKPILQGSIAFVRCIDEAAACMYALQHEMLAAH